MEYYKGNLKCPKCGSKDNQSFGFSKEDINLEEGTINVSAGCGVIQTIKHYMGITGNCGKPYNQTMKMTRAFKKELQNKNR